MDNYKIKVTDEVSNTEIQEALFELGCEWFGSTNEVKPLANCWIDVGSNGRLTWSFHGSDEKELTLPQLRDLVVLKRNDVKDANCIDKKREAWYLASDGTYYAWQYRKLCWDTESDACVEAHDIKPINQPQDPSLISGAEALRALADGKEVEANNSDFGYWIDARNLSVKDFFDDIHIFRLKPQTIKLELEIPAPSKAKIGGRDDTSFVLNIGRHQYCYNNEEDYTKARDALEAVFDAAVRGTNS